MTIKAFDSVMAWQVMKNGAVFLSAEFIDLMVELNADLFGMKAKNPRERKCYYTTTGIAPWPMAKLYIDNSFHHPNRAAALDMLEQVHLRVCVSVCDVCLCLCVMCGGVHVCMCACHTTVLEILEQFSAPGCRLTCLSADLDTHVSLPHSPSYMSYTHLFHLLCTHAFLLTSPHTPHMLILWHALTHA